MGPRGGVRFAMTFFRVLWFLLPLSGAPPAAGYAPHQFHNSVNEQEESFIFTGSRAAELSTDITLLDYNVQIEPDYQDPIESTTDFSGEVVFNFEVTKSTSSVVLHANNLDVSAVTVTAETTDFVRRFSVSSGKLTITMKSSLSTSTTYTATINFSGKIQDETHGFYKSTYEKEDGEKGVLFTTHFQPVHAREVFPCFDEPSFKTTYKLTIDVPLGYDALSNTLGESSSPITKDGSSLNRITFQKTVPMSSYLVAFVVYETSSFVSTHIVISDKGVPIRTWARKDAIEKRLADYSQDISFKILRELEDYTAEPYAHDNMLKIDQVAVPDFGAGAMENWGLVIYRQTRLLYDERSDSEYDRKRVAAIIAHELTHQWFGNLVTTMWWDTTWLNEGFARYFQYLILSRIFPSWRMMDQLLLDQQMAIFVSDSVSTAQPLNHDVTTSDDIQGQFGSITYSKGACIVRMMSYILGEDKFQEGLQQYLKRGTVSVTPEDLFSDLKDYVPEDRNGAFFEEAMGTWTTQPGFPVLHVERDYDTKTANISQFRFFTDGTIETEPTLYAVPIIWSSNDNSEERFLWLSETSRTIQDLPEIENWVLVHADGYYRVNYDEGNWMTLVWTLRGKNRSRIPPADRAKLVDDALALARNRNLPYRILSYMLRYLPTETDVLPWAAADRSLRFFHIQLGNIDTDGIFNTYLRHATSAIYEALNGLSRRGDAPELILRGTVLNWACFSGNKQCLDTARLQLEQFLYRNEQLDPNLKDVILCHGTRVGDRSMWEDLWDIYKDSADSTERITLLGGLGCTESSGILYTYLQRVTHGLNGANPSETNTAFQAAISHPKGVAIALDFLIEHYLEMQLVLPEPTIRKVLIDVTDQLSSEEQYKRISKFIEEQILINSIEETFGDGLIEKVKNNMEYIQLVEDEALKAFSDATPKEEVNSNTPIEPTESHGESTGPNLMKFLTLLVSISLLTSFVK